MKIKRLTTTQVVNGRNIKTITSKGKVTIQDLIDRLYDLEEKIENGTLIELPRIIHPNPLEWFVQFEYETGIIDYNIFRSEEKAQKRLEELKNDREFVRK